MPLKEPGLKSVKVLRVKDKPLRGACSASLTRGVVAPGYSDRALGAVSVSVGRGPNLGSDVRVGPAGLPFGNLRGIERHILCNPARGPACARP